jgi:hypothetical protein
MEYTRQVNFCGSCHQAMQPYLDDMLKPGHQSLAALHFQDRFAPTQAGPNAIRVMQTTVSTELWSLKLGGLHDAFSYMTGSYTMPIRLRRPLSDDMCLKCHVGAKPFMSHALHLDKTGGVSPLIPLWHHSLRNVPPSWHVSS